MTNPNKGSGAFNTGPLDAGPEQGGSNMGGLGSTGAMDRERDPEAEGLIKPQSVSSARDQAIIDGEKADDEATGVTEGGGS